MFQKLYWIFLSYRQNNIMLNTLLCSEIGGDEDNEYDIESRVLQYNIVINHNRARKLQDTYLL